MEFNQNNVLVNVDVANKEELFRFIADYALEQDIITDPEDLVTAFVAREAEVSTGLRDTFAIPHAKSDFIKRPTVLFLKLKHSIAWETFDGEPVSNVFALLVPNDFQGNHHLEMISSIATSLMEDEFIEILKNTQDVDKLVTSISKAMNGGF